MKRMFLIFLIALLPGVYISAEPRVLEEADQLYDLGKHQEVKELLLDELGRSPGRDLKFEMQWRVARATMEIGNEKEDQGLGKDALIAIYQEGVSWAEKAISTDSKNPKGYFWKSANLGRWGEVKGIMESLNMAKEMRELLINCITLDEEFGLGWHVLGILYERVPGGISFGDKAFAVSLARKAIDTHEQNLRTGKAEKASYGFYIELAKHLDKRNWNQRKRERNQDKMESDYRSSRDSFTKNCYYEATVTLKKMDDRDEAKQLLKWAIDELEGIRNPAFSERDDLKDAREALAEIR